MAQDNRAYNKEQFPREHAASRDGPESERSKFGEHPLPEDDQQPRAGEVLQSEESSPDDPLLHFPSDPAREPWRKAYETQPHDPSVDYHPPDAAMIAPKPNLSMKLLGLAAVLLFAGIIALVMLHNWMYPGPRHPGEHKQSPNLLQKLP